MSAIWPSTSASHTCGSTSLRRAFEKVQKAVKNRVAAMEGPAPLPVH
jgi:hypothetical protein